MDAQSILGCRKQDDESLHSIVYRFNKATLNVPEWAYNMVIIAFTYRLRPGILFKKLVGKPPKSTKEMMERVHRFMKQEEAESKK